MHRRFPKYSAGLTEIEETGAKDAGFVMLHAIERTSIFGGKPVYRATAVSKRNMIKCCLAILLVFLSPAVFAQLPLLQWADAFVNANENNYSTYNNGRSVSYDAAGNVYSAGLFMYTADFDAGTGVYKLTATGPYQYGIYLTKQDADGKLVWAEQLPLLIEWSAIEIKADAAGNLYLTAYIGNEADMDPGPGVYTLSPINGNNAFVAKVDTDGNLVWVKQFGSIGSNASSAGTNLTLDHEGNVIVCGSFTGTVTFGSGPGTTLSAASGGTQSFIVKLSSNGDFVWARGLGSPDDRFAHISIADIACDAQNNICITGGYSGNSDFDPGAGSYLLSSHGPSDGYIAKYDANGNFIWVLPIGNSSSNEVVVPDGIETGSDGSVYTHGTFQGLQDFGAGTTTSALQSINGIFDTYLLKLSAAGKFVWVKDIGVSNNDIGYDLAIDNTDNLYTLATFNGDGDLDPGPGTAVFKGLYDETVITKFDAGGNFIYAAPFLHTISGSNYGRRMAIDGLQNIYVTGFFGGFTDFDPSSAIYEVSSEGYAAPFVLKLSKCFHPTASTLSATACSSYLLNGTVYDSAGTYTQVIPNASGCDSLITLQLSLSRKYTTAAQSICEGGTFFAGGALQSVAGTYTDTLASAAGCDSIVTTTLTINPLPKPRLGSDRSLCEGTTLSLTPGNFALYLWQDGSRNSTFTAGEPGTYQVSVTDGFSCTASDTLHITGILPNPSGFLKASDSICAYDKLVLQPLQSFRSYVWSTGETGSTAIISLSGMYWLEVTDDNGCRGKDSIVIYAKECLAGVHIPDGFSPNGDGRNDLFRAIVHQKLERFRLQVFTRDGSLAFQSADPAKGWDGSSPSGIPYPAASVFVWQCTYQVAGRAPESQKGTLTLVR